MSINKAENIINQTNDNLSINSKSFHYQYK